MFIKIVCVVIFASSALSRNVQSFKDLDEEDQMLFRAAYDTPSYNYDTPSYNPSYNHEEYHDHEISISKLDLLKDGMWALKAKLKEIAAFNKALAANLLSTKLKVKELMEHHLLPLKKHHHVEIDKKPVYNYQPSQSPAPASYSQYEQVHSQYTPPIPQYTAPAPQYTASAPQYTASAPQYNQPAPQYTTPAPHYHAPASQYTEPAPQYTEPAPQYTEPAPQYPEPAPQYNAPAPQYNAPAAHYTAQHYGTSQHVHDPYYGQ